MANLYTTDLGANSRQAQPSSMFGTRDLVFISLSLYEYDLYTDSTQQNDDATTSYLDSDSLYTKLVLAIQEVAEMYYLGAPSRMAPTAFVFAISRDTAEWYNSAFGDNNDGSQYPGTGNLSDAITDLLQLNNGDPYSVNDIDLRELEDTGFGLMLGRFIY